MGGLVVELGRCGDEVGGEVQVYYRGGYLIV